MSNRFICLLLSLFCTTCYAQQFVAKMDHVHPIYKNDVHGDSIRKYFTATYAKEANNGIMMSAFYSNLLAVDYFKIAKKIPQLQQYSKQKSGYFEMPMNGYAANFAIPIFDTSGVLITVNGINPENARDYEFRVLENKTKVVVPWREPKVFTKVYWMSRIANPQEIDSVVAYLGQFKNAYDRGLTFEVRRKANPDSICVSMSAYWLKWKPKVVGVFTFAELPGFLNIFHQQWGRNQITENKDWSKDTTLLKLKNDFRNDENNLIFYLSDIVSSKRVTEYNLVNGTDSTGWKVNDFDFNLVWLKNLSPGKYTLKVRYIVQRDNVYEYPFTIHPAWYQTVWAKLGLFVLMVLAVGFIFLLWASRRQAARLKAQSNQKQLVQTELKSIRSQFNPHFVFNALSSIQGLITKNDQENASKYLMEFSTLMRDSLKASNREYVSISTEIKILSNYLNLEKLRFGFDYRIAVSSEIDESAIEIPCLLLQPIVENAVKHGISGLHEKGRLQVSFKKENYDMLVVVADNGNGFKDDEATTGFGLQLTKERIKLLNQMLKDQQIDFSVQRSDEQTQVIIHFKNWLL